MRPRTRVVETTGWWGCMTCKGRVGNGHTGPCSVCGGKIGRILPAGTQLNLDFGIVVLPLRNALLNVEKPKPKPNVAAACTALAAAAVLCIASPLMGGSTEGWHGVTTGMAMNIWSSSVGYYAITRLLGSTQAATA